MTRRMENGADLLCRTLESLGVEHVFGVPGTQSVLLYEADPTEQTPFGGFDP